MRAQLSLPFNIESSLALAVFAATLTLFPGSSYAEDIKAEVELANDSDGTIYFVSDELSVPAHFKAVEASAHQDIKLLISSGRNLQKEIRFLSNKPSSKKELKKLIKSRKENTRLRLLAAESATLAASEIVGAEAQTAQKISGLEAQLAALGVNTAGERDFGIVHANIPFESAPNYPGFEKSPNLKIKTSSQFKGPNAFRTNTTSSNTINSYGSGGSTPPANPVSICIVDTGVEGAHPAFNCGTIPCANNKILAAKSFINGENPLTDLNGHGSHVAGIAAGLPFSLNPQPGQFPGGVEPRASLIVAQVMDYSGSGSLFSLTQGLAFCLDPYRRGHYQDKANIINMSLGFSYALKSYNSALDALNRAFGYVSRAGVMIAKAAGNDREAKRVVSGNEFDSIDGSALAPYPEILTVGATDSSGNLAAYSSVGPQTWQTHLQHVLSLTGPDLLAQGTFCSVRSTYGTITNPCSRYGNTSWLAMASGTSMASPEAAGAAAKVLYSNRTLNGRELKELLRQSVRKLATPDPKRSGNGLLNITQSVRNAQNVFPIIDDSQPIEVVVSPTDVHSIQNIRMRAVAQSRNYLYSLEISAFRGGRTWEVLKRKDISGSRYVIDEAVTYQKLKGSAPAQDEYIIRLKVRDRQLISEAYYVVTTKDFLPPLIPSKFYAEPVPYPGVLCGNITLGFKDHYVENFKSPIQGNTYLVRVAQLAEPAERWSFDGTPGAGSVAINIDARRSDLNVNRMFSFINFFTDAQGNTSRADLHTGTTYRDWCRNGPPTPTPTPSTCTPPVITQHPVGGEYNQGDRIELEVRVDAQTLAQNPTYKWFKNSNELPDRTSIFVRTFDGREEGSYKAEVSLPCGSVLSNEAIVRRRPAP